ncbi:MAG: hypothetical protein K0S07_684 [Chlamydiales bacterium]|jgi:serine/threonine protein kinase|nr:hypothetical protein [Chlamydiales bacterium]
MNTITPSFFFQETSADSSYTKSGKRINASKKGPHVVFKEAPSNKFNIPCLTAPPSGKRSHRYVAFSLNGDKEVFLEIRTLAKRLHLDRKDIEAHGKTHDLPSHLNAILLKEGKTLSQAIDTYDLARSHYQQSLKDKKALISKLESKKIEKDELMMIIKTAYRALGVKNEKSTANYFKVDDLFYMAIHKARSPRSGSLQILEVSSESEIGKGSFGKVLRLFNVTRGENMALKVLLASQEALKGPQGAEALQTLIDDAHYEFNMLSGIHQSLKNAPENLAIVDKPFGEVIIYKQPFEESLVGILYTCYEGDLFECLSKLPKDPRHHLPILPPVEDRLFNALLITRSILSLHEKAQISHGDIKPENFLVKKMRYFLADFGHAKHLSNDSLKDDHPDACSIDYVCDRDFIEKKQALKESPPDYQRVRHIQKAQDVYALGLVLFEILTGFPPFQPDQPEEKPPEFKEKKAPRKAVFSEKELDLFLSFRQEIPTDVCGIIKEMIDLNHELRPSMDQVLHSLESSLAPFNLEEKLRGLSLS